MTNKIIVKVGNKSSLRFTKAKVIRIIDFSELQYTIQKYTDCNLFIIESISNDEVKGAKEALDIFRTASKENKILLYNENPDGILDKLAKALKTEIYNNIDGLHDAIYKETGLNVYTSLDFRNQINTSSIGLNSLSEEDDKEFIKDINEEVKDESIKEVEDNIVEFKNDIKYVEIHKEKAIIETNKTEEIKEINILNSENNDSLVKELNDKLEKVSSEYNKVLSNMKDAYKNIDSLNKIIKVLEDEKKDLKDRFNKLIKSDEVLEDPISLHQYEVLNSSIDKLKSKINSLEQVIDANNRELDEKDLEINDKNEKIKVLKRTLDSVNNQVNTLNQQIESEDAYKDKAKEYENEIRKLNKDLKLSQAEISSLKTELEFSNKDLADYKSEALTLQDRVSNLTVELDKLREEADSKLDNSKAIEENEKQLREKTAILEKRLFDESRLRIDTQDIIQTTLNKISSLYEEMDVLNDIKLKNEKSSKALEDKIREQTNTITDQIKVIKELEEKSISTDRKIELATNSANAEKAQMEVTINELQAKLNLVNGQLKQKEEQYNNLVKSSGIDENGANALLNNSKMLETTVKTLNEKLAISNDTIAKYKQKEQSLESQLSATKTQLERMNSVVKGISGSNAGAAALVGNNAIKPINYNGSAQIITVFSSAGHGATTTAMTIANKLCKQNSVLYIDFDLANPSADVWLKISPICNRCGNLNINKNAMTGLGIFYEAGIRTFADRVDYILLDASVDRTGKNGRLDLLSGAYKPISPLNIAGADYTNLFNVLGSKYKYIVVDMGRLGCSELNNGLIRAVCNISKSVVGVSGPEFSDVRSMANKLAHAGIDMTQIDIMINLSISSAVADNTRNMLQKVKYTLMFRDMQMFCTQTTFDRCKINKERFEQFFMTILN